MAVTLIHPGNEGKVQAGKAPERLATLQGKKIGLLDISKPGGRFFLDRLEELLRTRYEASDVIRLTKPTYTKNAPAAMIEQLRGVDAVVEGLADWGSCTTCSMHDTVKLENLGIPAVAVATTEFVSPARIQAGALGRPGFEAVYVEHPIQDQTPQQIAARADAVAAEIEKRLTGK